MLKNHQKLQKESGALKIKYTQNVLKTFAVPAGAVELKQHNLFFGNCLPDRVYLDLWSRMLIIMMLIKSHLTLKLRV